MLPHEHRNDLFVSDNEEIRDIGMFIKDDSIIQTLSGKSYGHKSEKASIYAHFYSLKQVSKLFISRDIDDFASGDFSYLGPLLWFLFFHEFLSTLYQILVERVTGLKFSFLESQH